MPTNRKDYMRSYYLANKEKFNGKVMCEACGYEVKKGGMARHRRTAKHQRCQELLEASRLLTPSSTSDSSACPAAAAPAE